MQHSTSSREAPRRWRTRFHSPRPPAATAPGSTPVRSDSPAPGVLRLCLKDGHRRNVLGRTTVDAIDEVAAAPPPGTHVLLLCADGPDFCAGYDLHEAQRDGPEKLIANESNFARLRLSRLPVVAALHGNVIGGGLELALVADIRIATPDARFAVPAGRLGVIYSAAGTRLFVDALGESVARAMLVGGVTLSADEAKAIGFVTEVVPPERLEERAMEIAVSIASWSPVVTSGNRRVLDAVTRGTDEDVAALQAEAFDRSGALVANIERFTASHGGGVVVHGLAAPRFRLALLRSRAWGSVRRVFEHRGTTLMERSSPVGE